MGDRCVPGLQAEGTEKAVQVDNGTIAKEAVTFYLFKRLNILKVKLACWKSDKSLKSRDLPGNEHFHICVHIY